MSRTAIDQLFHSAITANSFQNGIDYVTVCLVMCDYYRRLFRFNPLRTAPSNARINNNTDTTEQQHDMELDTNNSSTNATASNTSTQSHSQADADDQLENQSTIRSMLRQAANYLAYVQSNPTTTNIVEYYLDVYAYWSDLEAAVFHDVEKARGIWEECIAECKSHDTRIWTEYINMERQHGDITHVRAIYKRAITVFIAGWSAEQMCHAFLRFERECGSLQSHETAIKL